MSLRERLGLWWLVPVPLLLLFLERSYVARRQEATWRRALARVITQKGWRRVCGTFATVSIASLLLAQIMFLLALRPSLLLL